jgi:hypothetical protein
MHGSLRELARSVGIHRLVEPLVLGRIIWHVRPRGCVHDYVYIRQRRTPLGRVANVPHDNPLRNAQGQFRAAS